MLESRCGSTCHSWPYRKQELYRRLETKLNKTCLRHWTFRGLLSFSTDILLSARIMWVLAKVMTGFVEQKGRARQGQIPLFHSATCWVRALSTELCGLIEKLWIHRRTIFTLSTFTEHWETVLSMVASSQGRGLPCSSLLLSQPATVQWGVLPSLKCPTGNWSIKTKNIKYGSCILT